MDGHFFVWKRGKLKMKIRFDIRKECYCFDLTRAVIFSAVFVAVAMLVGLFGGSTHTYTCLLLPRFALGRGLFVIFWTLFYISFGFALEIILSVNRCAHREKAIYCFLIAVAAGYLWFPLFFGMSAFFFSFLLCIFVSILAFVSLKKLVRVNRFASIVMGIYFVWLVYCSALNFCIWILN
jgi:tryptophan-rich sensory protein